MSTPEQPTTDRGQSLPVEEKVPHMVDVAPLLRGEVRAIRIPVFKAKPGLNIEAYEAELRVVEEVEWDRKKPGCAKCGHPWSMLLTISTYCPGCGKKIKR